MCSCLWVWSHLPPYLRQGFFVVLCQPLLLLSFQEISTFASNLIVGSLKLEIVLACLVYLGSWNKNWDLLVFIASGHNPLTMSTTSSIYTVWEICFSLYNFSLFKKLKITLVIKCLNKPLCKYFIILNILFYKIMCLCGNMHISSLYIHFSKIITMLKMDKYP